MSNTIKVAYVLGADWEGLYVNGDLIKENHRIDLSTGISAIAKTGNNFYNFEFSTYEIDQSWIEEIGNLPKSFSEIPDDKITFLRNI